MDENEQLIMDENEQLRTIANQLHAIRQPLNVIALSCANIEARSRLSDAELTGEYLAQKISRINLNISTISELLDILEQGLKSYKNMPKDDISSDDIADSGE